jgi:hypothetical protein
MNHRSQRAAHPETVRIHPDFNYFILSNLSMHATGGQLGAAVGYGIVSSSQPTRKTFSPTLQGMLAQSNGRLSSTAGL